MSLKRAQEGYLIIDHRYSPGVLPGDCAKGSPIVPAGNTFESATITCAHCNRIVVLNPLRTRPRGYCAKCDHYICDEPGCGLECKPFAKLLDELQEQAARQSQS